MPTFYLFSAAKDGLFTFYTMTYIPEYPCLGYLELAHAHHEHTENQL